MEEKVPLRENGEIQSNGDFLQIVYLAPGPSTNMKTICEHEHELLKTSTIVISA